MLEYRTLKAIAIPPRFFFVSPSLFLVNIIVFGVTALPVILFNMNAMLLLVPLVLGHFVAMRLTARDIHAATIIRAWGQTRGKLPNRAPVSSGRKYIS